MAVPTYDQFMLPLLGLAADGQEHSLRDAVATLADRLAISEADREELLPSGTQTKIYNRVGWAIAYLNRALLIEKLGRGRFRITQRGRELLAEKPECIDKEFLDRYEEFRAFKAKRQNRGDATKATNADVEPADSVATPHERLDEAYKELREALIEDLLVRVRASSPKFFEHLVVDLLKAMGYGGIHASLATVTGKSGDGGIDGVIPEDRLGLDMVYVQAKKWEAAVGPDEIRKFVGSLGEQKAHKGVFITSGAFTDGALRAAEKANARVVLINGDLLASYMIDYGVGVADSKPYTVKKIDTDYFEPD